MTERQPPHALRCPPAAYRARHGAELTAIYAEATAGAGALGRLREAPDVAGHGLRQRTGPGSDRTTGQVLAQAAPLAVAVVAGGSLVNLLRLFTPGVRGLSWSSFCAATVLNLVVPLLTGAVVVACGQVDPAE
ncbi:hypothetical protein ACIQB5_21360 [Streptomyces sp. NPDC088560]|uniref:hypothetical protein n=1 Tax=Streptomyces sp. NPDC088560 TaxID=3365868 RepID=UPI00380264F4